MEITVHRMYKFLADTLQGSRYHFTSVRTHRKHLHKIVDGQAVTSLFLLNTLHKRDESDNIKVINYEHSQLIVYNTYTYNSYAYLPIKFTRSCDLEFHNIWMNMNGITRWEDSVDTYKNINSYMPIEKFYDKLENPCEENCIQLGDRVKKITSLSPLRYDINRNQDGLVYISKSKTTMHEMCSYLYVEILINDLIVKTVSVGLIKNDDIYYRGDTLRSAIQIFIEEFEIEFDEPMDNVSIRFKYNQTKEDDMVISLPDLNRPYQIKVLRLPTPHDSLMTIPILKDIIINDPIFKEPDSMYYVYFGKHIENTRLRISTLDEMIRYHTNELFRNLSYPF